MCTAQFCTGWKNPFLASDKWDTFQTYHVPSKTKERDSMNQTVWKKNSYIPNEEFGGLEVCK